MTDPLLASLERFRLDLRNHAETHHADFPMARYAERLVAVALDGRLAASNTPGHDLTAKPWGRVSVKSRRTMPDQDPDARTFLFGRVPAKWEFDYAAVVIFDEHWSVTYACLRTVADVRATCPANGQTRLRYLRGGTDVTARVQAVQAAILEHVR